MKKKRLLNIIGEIDDRHIVEAAPYANTRRKAPAWTKWVAVAACLCLLLGSALINRLNMPQYASEMLSISESDIGMGFEGYRVYDISEIRRDNPTDGVKMKALNVYRNTICYDERLYPYGQNLDAMKEYLLSLAGKFGLDTDSLEIFEETPNEDQMYGLTMEFASVGREVPEYYTVPTRVWVKTDDMKITVDVNMTAIISFEGNIYIPNEYYFGVNSTPDELTEVSSYLWEQYGHIIGYENPKLIIDGGDYDINGGQKYSLSFYDGVKDKADNFENYSFNRTSFEPGSICIYNMQALEKIGLYPLISEEEAKALLLEGKYYTTVTEEIPTEDAIVRCELFYRVGSKDKDLLPFYRFYVALENAIGMHLYPEGMKAYGVYYVPAVDGKYISNTSIWKGGFN